MQLWRGDEQNFRYLQASTAVPAWRIRPTISSYHRQEGIETLLQFWKQDGTLIKTVHGSNGEIRNVAWDKSSKYLVSARDRLRIWNVDGKLLYEAKEGGCFWAVDWNQKNNFILTASFSGKVMLWTGKGKFMKKYK